MASEKYHVLEKSAEFTDVTQVDTVSDLKISLQKNLKNVGCKLPKETIDFLIGAYLSHLPICIVGKGAEMVSKVLSLSIYGRMPLIIQLDVGYDDYGDLAHHCSLISSDVIVLKNAVGVIDESLYTHLSEDFLNHYFIFIHDSEEQIRYLPAGFLGYFGLVYCNSESRWEIELTPTLLSLSKEHTEYEPANYEKSYTLIRKYSVPAGLGYGYAHSRAKLLTVLNTYFPKKQDISLFIPEIVWFLILHNKKEEFLDDLDLDDDYYDLIEDMTV